MKYFTRDYIDFFKDLSAHNNKDWFHANKKRYEESVKNPFKNFVEKLIEEIGKLDKSVDVFPKDCILRINRDIRFAKDKSPYNSHLSAVISSVGKKDKSVPGIFIRFSPEMTGIMGGCYQPAKEQLLNIRTEISKNPKKFRKVIEAKDFVKKFGEIRGDALVRIPKQFQKSFETEPLIANKQFYFVAERKAEFILEDKLFEEILDYWKIMRPVNEYLTKAMS